MDIGELLRDDDENATEDKESAEEVYARAIFPYPLGTGGAQLLQGRTRACCFWISALVPDGQAYIVDSTQLLQGASWTHNPAQDAIPRDALLVVINPRYSDHIRKAMATWRVQQNPAFVAARIIDSQCRQDPTLAGRMKWKVSA